MDLCKVWKQNCWSITFFVAATESAAPPDHPQVLRVVQQRGQHVLDDWAGEAAGVGHRDAKPRGDLRRNVQRGRGSVLSSWQGN